MFFDGFQKFNLEIKIMYFKLWLIFLSNVMVFLLFEQKVFELLINIYYVLNYFGRRLLRYLDFDLMDYSL